MSTIGERIGIYRRQARLKQSDVADRLGISRSLVSQWEHDKCGISSAQMADLARVLHIDPAILFAEFLTMRMDPMSEELLECSKDLPWICKQIAVRLMLQMRQYKQMTHILSRHIDWDYNIAALIDQIIDNSYDSTGVAIPSSSLF